MTINIMLLISFLSISLVLVVFFYKDVKRLYQEGIKIWAQIIPLIAIMIISGILVFNFYNIHQIKSHYFLLTNVLNIPELFLLLCLLPLFFTRLINIISMIGTLYLIEKLIFAKNLVFYNFLGLIFIISSLIVLSILGDKAFWFNLSYTYKQQILGLNLQKYLRQFLIIFIGILSIVFLLLILVDINEFQLWIKKILNLQVNISIISILIFMVVLSWMLIMLNIFPHLLLSFIIIPSCIAFIYITQVSIAIFIIFFILLMSLWIALYFDTQTTI